MTTVCAVSTIKAPLNETMMFINYHLNIGIDEIIIFFDDPNDAAIDNLSGYRGVNCVRCDNLYWQQNGGVRPQTLEDRQILNANNALQMARKSGFDWAAFIDNDELIYPIGSLKNILSGSGADVIQFAIREAVSEEEHCDNIYTPTLFKKPGGSFQNRLAMLMGCRRAFFEGRYFRGHIDSKVAIRLKADIKKMGIHRPAVKGPDVVNKSMNEVLLLHYDCVGIEAWKRKWLGRTGASVAKGIGRNRRRQHELFVSAARGASEDEFRALYDQLYLIPRYEKGILKMLNMLSRIEIDKKLFETPSFG